MQPLRVIPAQPERLFTLLEASLFGRGPALLPVALDAPDSAEHPHSVPDETCVVLSTSGSTGTPKRVALSARALLASAAASEQVLGRGQWLQTLPAHYIAGLQQLVRCHVAGTTPVLMPGPFSVEAFVAGVRRISAGAAFTSLVPAQLQQLLDAPAESAALPALRRFDAVLLGGQAAGSALLERAAAAGVALVRSYGSSETAGGCVYDGRAIGDTRLRIRDGLLEISGSSLALGYLNAAGTPDQALGREAFTWEGTQRWYRSHDRAELVPAAEGTLLNILGRADDVFISGGLKASLAQAQAVLEEQAEFSEVQAVVVPDERWGQRLVVVARLRNTSGADVATELARLREVLGQRLGPAAKPARLLLLSEPLPRLASGKVDRERLVAMVGT